MGLMTKFQWLQKLLLKIVADIVAAVLVGEEESAGIVAVVAAEEEALAESRWGGCKRE